MGFGWISVVLVIVLAVWLLGGGKFPAGPAPKEHKSALEILEERYARGEIGHDEFEQKKRDLEA